MAEMWAVMLVERKVVWWVVMKADSTEPLWVERMVAKLAVLLAAL